MPFGVSYPAGARWIGQFFPLNVTTKDPKAPRITHLAIDEIRQLGRVLFGRTR